MPYFLIIPLWFVSMVIIAPLYFVRSAKRFSVRWMFGSTLGVWLPWIVIIFLPRGPNRFLVNTFNLLLIYAAAWWGVRMADRLGDRNHWPV